MWRLPTFATAALLLTSCYWPSATYNCHMPFAHPTMSQGDIASRVDLRVRSLSEGSAGRLRDLLQADVGE